MDDLRSLLRTHQGTVYNICYQVLRSAHDAEDAAQDALLEIVKGIAGVREPRAFKRWICRVALHTALDHLRRHARRKRHEEARAAMNSLPRDPATDAIHETLAKLDDDDRCLLVEKYFERTTLEEIGAREGISTSAAGKRLERARERLKRRLIQAGVASAAAGVDRILEAAEPAAAIPDLVSTSAALKSALALTGGTMVGMKSAGLAASAVVFVVLLLGGGGYLVRTGRRLPANPVASARAGDGTSTTSGPREHSGAPKSGASADSPAVSKAATDPAELVQRLDRFKAWLDRDRPLFQEAEDVNRWFQAARREAAGLRDLILEHPAAFIEWLTQYENTACASDLLAVTLSGKSSPWDAPSQEFASFPAELTRGLLGLLMSGGDFVRVALLQFALTLKDPPASYRDRYIALLSDPDDDVSHLAARCLLSTGEFTSQESGVVLGFLEKVTDFEKRATLFQTMGQVEKPQVRDWLMTTLESGRFDDPHGRLTFAALEGWLAADRSPGSGFEERAARILAAAMHRVKDPQGYFYLVFGGLSLPQARSLLTQAMAGAPTEQLRKAAAALLDRPEADLKDATARRGAWLDAYWAK